MLFSGCGTALVTPFTLDGSVDYSAYCTLLERQVAQGADFLVPLATTGETPTLSLAERRELLRLAREHAGGRKLLVGCGGNSLQGTLDNIASLDAALADGYLVVVPYYNKPTQEGMYQYFKAVAASTDKGIIIYNVPGRTGANILPDTVIRLARDCRNIIGIKEASGSFSQGSEIIRRAPEGFAVLSGDDDLTFALMAAGGHGVISVASNVVPAEVAAMCRYAAAGDFLRARALHHRLSPLFRILFVESNPIPVKAALALLGLCTDRMRLPLVSASAATKEKLGEVLAAIPNAG
ncbi:MAG: 4-hydroxy-tetrahydrodipicolinate synthase [Bacteroidales bacterium]|nr:4-hydroxy-tetrahydrodipicolinate synthase [Bacteroidales bacterium]